ncbi:MAG: CoA transferase [Dehalococcoidia bacterium]|nr:CoA transferase [Dehalococcoidia bacterium]
MPLPLEGVRVLEVGTFVSAPYCGRLFAGYGAEVIKVEPPGGDIARAHGPFKDGEPNPETSALFLYLITSKRSVELDLGTQAGRDALLRLAADADVLIENYRPGDARALGLDPERLRAVNPRLVVVSITAYGQDGPYAEYHSNNLIAFAMGGQMFLTGDPDKSPVKNGGYQADYQGGLNAFSAANLALLAAERDGEGQHVDISVQHCMAPILEAGIPFYAYNGLWLGQRRGNLMSSSMAIYPCLDGQVGVHVMARNWPNFAEATGHAEWLEDERYATAESRRAHDDELMAELITWAASLGKKEAYALGGEYRAPITFIHTMEDLLDSPQLAARGFLRRIEHPVAGEASYPGPPWWMGPDAWRDGPAPLLGEHTDEVLAGAGLSKTDIAIASGAGA